MTRSVKVGLAVTLTAFLASCESTPDYYAPGGGGDEPPPRQGVIIFHDPMPRTGGQGRTQQALTFIFKSEPSQKKWSQGPLDSDTRVSSIAEKRARALRTDPLIEKAMQKMPVNFIHPDDFAALWKSLVDADLFLLPEYASRTAPKHRPYILLDDGAGRRHIFPRPDPNELAGYPEEEIRRILPVWGKCKILLATMAQVRR